MVDEWGGWYAPCPAPIRFTCSRTAYATPYWPEPEHLYPSRRPRTQANIAQMINVLQAMILTDHEKMANSDVLRLQNVRAIPDSTYLPLR